MEKLSTWQKITSAICKVIVAVSAIVGTGICLYAGRNSFMGGRSVFLYFTTQSNWLLAAVCLIGLVWMLTGKPFTSTWYTIKFVSTISITLTGLVFCLMLAPTSKNPWSIQNLLTHVVVPAVSVVDFFITGLNSKIKKWKTLFVLVPPFCYVIFAAIGYVNHLEFSKGEYYPYFFLNWGSEIGAFGFAKEPPFLGTFWWIVVLCILLLLFGLAYLWILDGLKKLRNKNK